MWGCHLKLCQIVGYSVLLQKGRFSPDSLRGISWMREKWLILCWFSKLNLLSRGSQGCQRWEAGHEGEWVKERVPDGGPCWVSSSVTPELTPSKPAYCSVKEPIKRPIKLTGLSLPRQGGLTVEEKPSFYFRVLLLLVVCYVSVCFAYFEFRRWHCIGLSWVYVCS